MAILCDHSNIAIYLLVVSAVSIIACLAEATEPVPTFNNISSKNPFHVDFATAPGDKNNLKVLVVAVDNRSLRDDPTGWNAYPSMTAVLQHDYCKKHGYDYVRIRNHNNHFVQEVRERYPNAVNQKFQENMFENFWDLKHGVEVFHPGYLRGRASSWGKLPALWYTLEQIGHRYDYIWFMDSDATPNPLLRSQSLSQALERWSSNTTHWVKWGKVPPKDATFLFMSNFPYRDDLPCAGTIIIKPSQLAKDAIREWWDYDLIYKALEDFMEQDALWYMIEAGMEDSTLYSFLINATSTVLLTEQQFFSPWKGYNSIWFAHVPSSELNGRQGYFRTMLRQVGLHLKADFLRALNEVRDNLILRLPFLHITEQMEELRRRDVEEASTAAGSNTDGYNNHSSSHNHSSSSSSSSSHEQSPLLRGVVHYYPPERTNAREDAAWHEPRDVESRPPHPPVGSLYNGFAVQMMGDPIIYVVFRNKKHPFENTETFHRMGFTENMVIQLEKRPKKPIPFRDISFIETGPEIMERAGFRMVITDNYALTLPRLRKPRLKNPKKIT